MIFHACSCSRGSLLKDWLFELWSWLSKCICRDTLFHPDGGRGGKFGLSSYSSPYAGVCSFKRSMNLNAELPFR